MKQNQKNVHGRASWRLSASSAVLFLAGALAAAPAFAADEPSADSTTTVREIVVTAQKRSENLQRVPIAVSAISGDTATSKGVSIVDDLNVAVPGLNVSRTTSSGLFFIRGVGTNSVNPGVEQPVAYYVDGVYMASASADTAAFSDVDHIEVLKGAQGTLFGRNTTGGVVQVITKDPSFTPGGKASLGYGNYDTTVASLYLTTGFGDHIAGDISLYANDQRKGWGHNVFDGQGVNYLRNYTARTKWIFIVDPSMKLTLAADYSQTYDDLGSARQVLGGLPNPLGAPYGGVVFNGNIYDTNSNSPDFNKIRNDGISFRIDKDFGAFKVVNILANRETKRETFLDLDETQVDTQHAVFHFDKTDTISEELQILSPDSSPIKWIAGLYYLNDVAGVTPLTLFVTALGPAQFQRIYDVQRLKSYSVFAQASIPVFGDSTHLILGARDTRDDRVIDGTIDTAIAHLVTTHQSATWTDPTFKVGLDHQFTPDVMGYLSVSTGFRSGLYNATTPQGPVVNPEKLLDYEAGVKAELLDHRLRLNTSLFWYDYKDLQFTQFTGSSSILKNAARARIYGGELEGDGVISDEISMNFGLSLINGTYTSFPNAVSFITNPVTGKGVSTIINESGHKVMRQPAVSGNLGFDFHHRTEHGLFGANLTYYYNGGFYMDPDNQYKQKAYSLVNAELRWVAPGDKWGVRLWGKNINDAKYFTVIQTSNNAPPVAAAAAPRTFGATIDYRF